MTELCKQNSWKVFQSWTTIILKIHMRMDEDWKAIFLNAHNYVGKVELQVPFFFDKMYYC